jgi:hypothetical protein
MVLDAHCIYYQNVSHNFNKKSEFYTTLATIDDYTYFTYFRFSIM